ncbi:hypothetical protein F444_15802 [Phytophthora nicotianae P1976]|uniref:Uncharacterized protein n=1 Tax=Phytophthora nicotianae P1976 TaxID=1317066 RepID=A0A080ZKN5_PHYNI|nr:hypothetical protein F444_15802 [Phytophthora nicotianae P1976]
MRDPLVSAIAAVEAASARPVASRASCKASRLAHPQRSELQFRTASAVELQFVLVVTEPPRTKTFPLQYAFCAEKLLGPASEPTTDSPLQRGRVAVAPAADSKATCLHQWASAPTCPSQTEHAAEQRPEDLVVSRNQAAVKLRGFWRDELVGAAL